MLHDAEAQPRFVTSHHVCIGTNHRVVPVDLGCARALRVAAFVAAAKRQMQCFCNELIQIMLAAGREGRTAK